MSILGNDLLLGSGDEGYNLTRSLRFRSSASAYLNRTPTNAGNRKTFTWSGWVKRGALGINGTLFSNGNGVNANGYFSFRFNTDNTVSIFNDNDGTLTTCDWSFTNVFRDVAAWYHLILAIDTTQATQTNRLKLYVNGVENTNRSVVTYPSQNSDLNINRTVPHQIGQFGFGSSQYFDGYLAEVNFIDGQALTPSSFGSTNTLTGVWQPAPYTGSYGTNGFILDFEDNSALTTSSNVGLGKDTSGNGNYWTTNNISITAGVTYDSMTDVCTLTSATAANFAVLNPLSPNLAGTPTFSNANLFVNCASASNFSAVPATMQLPTTGKWYAEFTATNVSTVADIGLLGSTDIPPASGVIGTGATSYNYRNNGNKINNNSSVAYAASYTTGDIIAIAFDATAGTLTFYKNNVSQGTAFTGLTAQYFFAVGGYNYTQWTANFGQRPFTYTLPTNFVALNTFNLPDSTIVKGNTVMDATLYTGNGSTQTITNAAGFKPDLVWAKARSSASWWHILVDSVRGVGRTLSSNVTNAEIGSGTDLIPTINSNGFNINVSPNATVNENGTTYVAWQWQAGQGTTSSNTSGTITSTVSVNASAGFSVVTYTGTGVAATVGHGLGVAPSLIIVKRRNSTSNWNVYHASVGATGVLLLNLTDTTATTSVAWNNTAPTSSVFTVGTGNDVNASGGTFVAYCFASIAGFSSFANYTGNGSTDGVFVYTGFRPKFVMIKRTNVADDWYINDTIRDPINVTGLTLLADSSNAEANYSPTIDILSNGFKVRQSGAGYNASGGNYVYTCWAETPFKNALAR